MSLSLSQNIFLVLSAGVDKEDFLLLRVVEASEEDLPHVDALYFLKILSKLESCGRPDVVVDVADAAIKTLVASGNETNVSTLYSLLFRHHLDAGHIYVCIVLSLPCQLMNTYTYIGC